MTIETVGHLREVIKDLPDDTPVCDTDEHQLRAFVVTEEDYAKDGNEHPTTLVIE